MTTNLDISESSDEEDFQKPLEREDVSDGGILCGVTGAPSEFIPLKKPGAAQDQDIDSDTEMYLFVIPEETINPLSLINTEIVVGSSKGKDLDVEGMQYKIVSYKNSSVADTPTLFLPNEMGELHRVNSEIMGHVIIKGQPKNLVNHARVNIEALRSVRHQPPMDIKERNFFNNASNEKESKSRKRRSGGQELEGMSPRITKKKKKKEEEDEEIFWKCDENTEASGVQELEGVSRRKKKKKKKKEEADNEISWKCDENNEASGGQELEGVSRRKEMKKEEKDEAISWECDEHNQAKVTQVVEEDFPFGSSSTYMKKNKKQKHKKQEEANIDFTNENLYLSEDPFSDSHRKKKKSKLNVLL